MTPHPARPDRLPLALSELALLGVHLAVVVGFARLYEGWSFFGDLAAFTVAAHVLATVTRRRRLPVPLTVVVALGGAAVVAGWLLFPASTRFGLPTAETWDLARESLRLARSRFEEVAAPAPVLPGFQLASGLALWWAVWFGDWAAFRLRATVEAVGPASVLFVFGALLGSGHHQLLASASFTAAVVGFVAAHRALRAQLDQHWLAPSPATGPRAVLRAGAGLAVVGVLAGVVIGPRLPGTGEPALVRWRDESGPGGDRTTVSPIVDLRKRLVDQSDTELFTVRTDRRAYQRLTALDRFDGELWSSGGQFSPAGGRLAGSGPSAGAGPTIRQEIEIEALSAIWAPAAFEARALQDSSRDLRWDPASSTLIVDRSEPTSDGLAYTVISQSPSTAAAALEAAGSRDPAEISRRYEQLPVGFPFVALRTARDVTAGAGSRYAQAVALQDWFRTTFRYSLDVPPGHGDDALVAFLASKEGYCEQFAGAYAAMARSLGIPARVAVGFTPGDPDPDDPTLYRIRGRHAHAWPEVWFPDVGWVPFEPTPGRGMPGAEAYTGVPEAQDDATPTVSIVTTTTSTTTTPGTPPTAPATTAPDDPRAVPVPPAGDGPDTSPPTVRRWAWAGALALLLAAAGWLLVVLLAPLVRRRRPAPTPAGAVLDAWHDAVAPVRWRTGLSPDPAETHREFAARAARALDDLALPFAELATLATRAGWDPGGPDDSQVRRARTLSGQLRSAAIAAQGPWSRLRRRLSWREALGRPQRSDGGGGPSSASRRTRSRSRSDVVPR